MIATAQSWIAPRRVSRSRFVNMRGLTYHIREWGRSDAPTILLLHGGRDVSATFQFLVDAMGDDWHFIAPDWRGHGLTDRTPGHYWLSDFLADLDALVCKLFKGKSVVIVSHSMGANVAGVFAGLRPDRVSRLVLLDALGNLLDLSPVPIADTLLRFLESPEPDRPVRPYPSVAAMAKRLKGANPRLTDDMAGFLALHLSRPAVDGGHVWAKDTAFYRSFPSLHNTAEWGACWSKIEARVLCLLSSDPRDHAVTSDPDELRTRAAYFRDLEMKTIPDTGHNVHQDAPHAVAQAIESFLHNELRPGRHELGDAITSQGRPKQ